MESTQEWKVLCQFHVQCITPARIAHQYQFKTLEIENTLKKIGLYLRKGVILTKNTL
jgi:hypothetical protein